MTKENSTFMAEFACSDARKIADKSNSKLLETLLEKFKNVTTAGCKSLAIFDIDSTLLDMSYRTGGIFKEFSRLDKHRSDHKELCQAIDNWETITEVYDPIAFINHHNTDYQVNRNSTLGDYLMEYWRKRFFNSDWLNHDLPYFGAQSFVNECLNCGADIAYLTGRDKSNVFNGTLRSLTTHRFPLDTNNPKTRIMLKPNSSMKDIIYKDEGIAKFKKGYDHVVFIDNEVELVNMAAENHREIDSYLFDSVHSGRVQDLKKDIPKIVTWSR